MPRSAYKTKDGKNYLHVTSALSIIRKPALEMWRGSLGNSEANRIMNEARKEGKLFHEYTKMIDIGEGDEIEMDQLPEPVADRLKHYIEWHFENVEEVKFVEEVVYSDKYLYMGKPDVIYRLKGRKTWDLFDRKSGKIIDRDAAYQLSAYKEALKEDKDINVVNRFVLHCRPYEPVKVIALEQKDHNHDFQGFLAAMSLYNNYHSK